MTPETIIAKTIDVLRDQFRNNLAAHLIAERFAENDPEAVEFAVALCTRFDTDDALVDFLTRIFTALAKSQAALAAQPAPAEPT